MTRTVLQGFGFLVNVLLVSATMCRADTITINLMPSLLSGSPGSTITFSGTLSNTTASTVFLKSAGINLSGGFTPADEDTSPFFTDTPLFLAAHGSTPAIDLFAIGISIPSIGGLYQGAFTVLGGADGNAQDILGSANFTVQVNSPEPSSGDFLVATGLLLLLFLVIAKYRRSPAWPG